MQWWVAPGQRSMRRSSIVSFRLLAGSLLRTGSLSLLLVLASSVASSCVVSNQGPPGTQPDIPLPPREPRPEPAVQEGPAQVSARHILISYRGAMRAAPYIEREKEEARTFAEELQKRAAGGEDFSKLAEENSDDPGSAAQGGSLGTFSRDQMVREFADTAFALEIGDVSEVVESPFGFHVILRDE